MWIGVKTMLLATKIEVDTIAALLEQGAESPKELAKVVIKTLTELREQRKFQVLIFELSPRVYTGFGPFSTTDQAFNSVDKNPMAYIAKNAAIVPVYGASQTKAMHELADAPPAERGDLTLVREDVRAFRNGWKGNVRDRDKFLQST